MKFYNKYAVVKWSAIEMLSVDEKDNFLKLFKKACNLSGNTHSKYYVIGKNELFAPAVKELIRAYCK